MSICARVRACRRSYFPAEAAARTERKAAPHHRLCVNHPVNTTSALAASASHDQEDPEHIFIQASIPQLSVSVADNRRVHPSFLFCIGTDSFSRCILFSPGWFSVIIAFCEGETWVGTRNIIINPQWTENLVSLSRFCPTFVLNRGLICAENRWCAAAINHWIWQLKTGKWVRGYEQPRLTTYCDTSP